MQDKSLLFVDIDGVISTPRPDSDARPAGALHDVDESICLLSSDAAADLLARAERLQRNAMATALPPAA